MRWSTYWFRLQNTTLFFYTKKDGTASHLRGMYYIYTVQSVKEIQRGDGKRFVFEILMNNGKRKVLAAETAALRKEWIKHLWRAMHLSYSAGSDPVNIQLEVCEQRDRDTSSTSSHSDCDSVMESQGGRVTSDPAAPAQSYYRDNRSTPSSLCSPDELVSEEATSQDTLPPAKYPCERLNRADWSSDFRGVEETEAGDYDVLPPRNSMYYISHTQVDLAEEFVYDVPLSNRSAEYREMTESIYDVPSSFLRRISEHTLEDPVEEGEITIEDMMTSLGGESAGLANAPAAYERPYTPVYF
ncbi:uncharacterized protein LOC130119405 [Lampris incognitus]|uniref:uncharacterized protein LOC130119405 n=1 Tax=Lampris incognitus TaxID=2546036 RepID=UPI0024B5E223|nr:uncharacterized protein LOC130119405 [Lampris incognitus]